MSKRIYAGISHDFERRMRNWASFNARGGEANPAPSSMWSGEAQGGYREATMPKLEGEAQDTDRALNAIPVRYRQAVMLFWQYEGQSMTYLGRRCACERHTYENRVIEGHMQLSSELARYSLILSDMREQFKKSQAA